MDDYGYVTILPSQSGEGVRTGAVGQAIQNRAIGAKGERGKAQWGHGHLDEERAVDKVYESGGDGEEREVGEAGEEAEKITAALCAEGGVFGLEFEMEGFVAEDAGGDGFEEVVLREFEDGGVVRDGEAFGAG